MKSEGDTDLVTPLYAMGVTGVFTKTLDAALLNNRIDIAVHSMKDVPTQLAQGIQQAAVLKRASHKDIFVAHPDLPGGKATLVQASLAQPVTEGFEQAIIATGSVRRVAQWIHQFPAHKTENLRGNVNTRLRKLKESNWAGAIFAAAGLERIHLRPEHSIDLDWMLPAPAQGAIMVVCRDGDEVAFDACQSFNDEATALCTKIERDFLSALMGGCSTPISALAEIREGKVFLNGNVLSPDGKQKAEVEMRMPVAEAGMLGLMAADKVLAEGGLEIIHKIRNKGLADEGKA
jgi:hydroxymethylbilane synthase